MTDAEARQELARKVTSLFNELRVPRTDYWISLSSNAPRIFVKLKSFRFSGSDLEMIFNHENFQSLIMDQVEGFRIEFEQK